MPRAVFVSEHKNINTCYSIISYSDKILIVLITTEIKNRINRRKREVIPLEKGKHKKEFITFKIKEVITLGIM